MLFESVSIENNGCWPLFVDMRPGCVYVPRQNTHTQCALRVNKDCGKLHQLYRVKPYNLLNIDELALNLLRLV